jgi:hypothetical protein
MSPGTTSSAGILRQCPSRSTRALTCSRLRRSASASSARRSCANATTALNARSMAITSASSRRPSRSWSTITASSIHGTGPQNRAAMRRHAGIGFSTNAFGPPFARRRAAAASESPSVLSVRGDCVGRVVKSARGRACVDVNVPCRPRRGGTIRAANLRSCQPSRFWRIDMTASWVRVFAWSFSMIRLT